MRSNTVLIVVCGGVICVVVISGVCVVRRSDFALYSVDPVFSLNCV